MFIAARAAAGLIGRNAEVELLTALLDGINVAGSTLVFGGEPGIGKSRLLAEAARPARDRGMTVLRASGVRAEAIWRSWVCTSWCARSATAPPPCPHRIAPRSTRRIASRSWLNLFPRGDTINIP